MAEGVDARSSTTAPPTGAIVPVPARGLGRARPSRPRRRTRRYERLWSELEHILRLDEPDPQAAWDERMAVLNDVGRRGSTERRFDAIELRGPGNRADRRPAADAHAGGPPTSRPPTACATSRTSRPRRCSRRRTRCARRGHVTSTKPLVLNDGTIIRGLRVRFEAGLAVEVDADENGERAPGAADDRRGRAAGSASSHSSTARAASARSEPSSTTRCWTRTPRATSRSAVASRSSSRATMSPASTRAARTSTS